MSDRVSQSSAVLPMGCVETFSLREITGFVLTASGEPARVDLYLDDLLVSSVWASEQINRNGSNVSGFRVPLRQLWRFTTDLSRVSLRIGDAVLPIPRHGAYFTPKRNRGGSVEELRSLLETGHVFTHQGTLQLSKRLDHGWQDAVIDLYRQVSETVRDKHGYELFVFYGSLLGQAREEDFLGHDNDFDVAYVSRLTGGAAVSAELRDIALDLIDAGFAVDTLWTALHIWSNREPKVKIDLFHTYFGEDGNLRLPFGRAGDTELHRDQWQGTTKGRLGRHEVRIPVNAKAWAAHIYGESWQIPAKGFNWDRARTAHDAEARMPLSLREEAYWANFYAHHSYATGSTFFDFIDARPDAPLDVLDIGCGDGRDSLAFAQRGRRVTGIDRSATGLNKAASRAKREGVDPQPDFVQVDVSDTTSLSQVIDERRARADGRPLLFYLRFFLHSIPADAQADLLATLARKAIRGDVLAAEFRGSQDAEAPKSHGKHYRRFQDGDDFVAALEGSYGFTTVYHHEGAGLSPYKDEDPVLVRVVAHRRARLSLRGALSSFARRTPILSSPEHEV